MRVIIAGASGFIGTALRRVLAERGDTPVALVRREPARHDEVRWDPASDRLDPLALRGADAIVNLAGASVGRLPWTRAYRVAILESRLAATGTIVRALRGLAAAGEALPALINASAVGYYGSQPGVELDESARPGADFLAGVVQRWEAAASAAPEGVRVALARTGLVIGDGGSVAPLRLLARLGVAGPLGGGRQHWPWISLRDEAAALAHLIHHPISGPVNLAGPAPATAADVVRGIARHLGRPYWLPAPAPLLTLALGDAARALLLADQLEVPRALLDSGFTFGDPTLADAISRLHR